MNTTKSIPMFRERSLKERIFYFWPPYRRKREAETKAAIRWLIDYPEAPCIIGDTFIPNGYGNQGVNWHGLW